MNERRFRGAALTGAVFTALAVAPAIAQADVWGTQFESSGYTVGQNIDGQNDWSDTGQYDATIQNPTPFATNFGFGSKSLMMSSARLNGGFGDQTYTPSVADEAGETSATSDGLSGGIRQTQYKLRFRIGASQAASTDGALYTSVSPDRGDGSRMSYLRFEDGAINGSDNKIHVFFDDVPSPTTTLDPGDGKNHVAFTDDDIAQLDRTVPHLIELSIDFKDGENNDVVKVSIDGNLVKTGTTWENYYRHDDEASAHNGLPPTVDSLLLREGGDPVDNNPSLVGKGFLFDDFRIETTSPGANQGPIGPTGPGGAVGTTGPQGTVGTTGPQGTVGNTGPQGTQGPSGADGLAGTSGTSGTNGKDGTNGTNGADGAPGSTGPQGLPGQSTPAGQAEPNPPVIVSKSLKPNKKRQISVKLRCPASAGICDGRLSVTVGRTSLGGLSFLVAGGKTLTLKFQVPQKLLTLAAKKKKVAVNVFSRDSAGTASLITKKVTFKK
jgi:hypothetical protein